MSAGARAQLRGTRCARAAIVALALAICGCGFQLRGAVALPAGIQQVAVQSNDALNPLRLEIERNLRSNRIAIAALATPASNIAQIAIVQETLQREILSVNERARVSEFLLRYRAEVQITLGDMPAMAAQTLELSREYSFDERQALGAAQEEDIIARELRADMAALIVRKLAAGQ